MPIRLEDRGEMLEQAGHEVSTRAKRIWSGFSDFALQDNVLQVAVGLILATAFTTTVTSFVSEILLPPISLLPFMQKNMEEKFAVLRPGNHYNQTLKHGGYNTLALALEDGAVVMAYGKFINKVFNFIGVGLALYMIASFYEWLSHDPIIKHMVKCKYCRKYINVKAKRCINCTSWMDGREDRNGGH